MDGQTYWDMRSAQPDRQTPAAAEPTETEREAEQGRTAILDRIADYNAEVRRIRADDTLSDKGRQEALQNAYDMTSGTVAALNGNTETTTTSRVQDLNRSLFGLSTTAPDSAVITHRDAQDRVSQMQTPEQLGELMERANATGDSALVRAGFAHAHQRARSPIASEGWSNLVDAYLAENPDQAVTYGELTRLTTNSAWVG